MMQDQSANDNDTSTNELDFYGLQYFDDDL